MERETVCSCNALLAVHTKRLRWLGPVVAMMHHEARGYKLLRAAYSVFSRGSMCLTVHEASDLSQCSVPAGRNCQQLSVNGKWQHRQIRHPDLSPH